MIGFDDAVPSLAELLGQQPKMSTYQEPEQGLANVLAPQEAAAAPAPAQGPGLLEQGKGFLTQNPQMGSVLLHTMLSLAQGHNLGSAIANGGRAALLMQAQGKEDQLRQEKIAREQQQQTTENELKGRQIGAQERTAAASERRADSTDAYHQGMLQNDRARIAQTAPESAARTGYIGAQTKALEQKTTQDADKFGLEKEQLSAQISHLKEQIASSKDITETRKLQRQLDQVKLKYADASHAADVTAKDLQNSGQAIENEGKTLKNMAFRNAPPEAQQAAATGVGKTGAATKTSSDKFQEYLTKNMDKYADFKTDTVDMARARKDFAAIEAYGKPGSQPAPAPGGTPQEQFDALFNAAKPGDVFTFQGKIYRKPAK